ncbi:hypothetical protein LOZ48_002457, partial [Ophidiomyces ophidiicola]
AINSNEDVIPPRARIIVAGPLKDTYGLCSARTEQFALGSLLYFMVYGHEPYENTERELSRSEFDRRFGEMEFPDLNRHDVFDGLILACWHNVYPTMALAAYDFKRKTQVVVGLTAEYKTIHRAQEKKKCEALIRRGLLGREVALHYQPLWWKYLNAMKEATGTKCLSSSQIAQCQGLVLHDSHAEILALRAFNNWLLKECESILLQSNDSGISSKNSSNEALRFLELRTTGDSANKSELYSGGDEATWPPFKLKSDVKIWMYCTCAPCGDGSMELCMAAQEDPTPWATTSPEPMTEVGVDLTNKLLDGRARFSALGTVRRKPSRPDAQPTLSKSCSDKLAAKQVLSVLSFPAYFLIAPSPSAYLANLLLPEDEIHPAAFDRCFGTGETGRLRVLNGEKWKDPESTDGYYEVRPFGVRSITMKQANFLWQFSKQRDPNGKLRKPGNISALWIATPSRGPQPAYTLFSNRALEHSNCEKTRMRMFPTNITETIINGVKQGYYISSLDARKASVLSRAKEWQLLKTVVQQLPGWPLDRDDIRPRSEVFWDDKLEIQHKLLRECVFSSSYLAMKQAATNFKFLMLRAKASADVRGVLGNWIENRGDEQWGLNVLAQSQRKPARGRTPKKNNAQ